MFFNKSSADSNDFTNDLEQKLAPRLAAHRDAILLDSQLYWRVTTVFEQLETQRPRPPEQRVPRRALAHRDDAGRCRSRRRREGARCKDLNQRISTLTTPFEKNLLADTNDLAVHVTDDAELDGLDAGRTVRRRAGRRRPRPRGLADHARAADRATRTSRRSRTARCGSGSWRRRAPADRTAATTTIASCVLEIARLRAERAALLGFANHAAAVTADETARTPEAVAEMLTPLAASAAKNAREEQVDLDAMNPDEVLEAVRLGVLHREGAAGEVRRRHRGAPPLVRGRAGAAGRRLLRGEPAVRRHLHRAVRPGRLPPRRPHLRGDRRGRHGGRALRARPVHPRLEARRRLDEPADLAERPAAASGRRRQQPQRAEAGRRRADAADVRRGVDVLPRVRARAARAVRARDVPEARRHERVPRLRRVPEPGQRDVDALARGARELREAPRDRRADRRRRRRAHPGVARRSTRASRRASTWPPRCSTRPGTR